MTVFLRNLWNFIAAFPPKSSQFMKRRILSIVRLDLLCWNKLLPTYNRILFFDTQARKTIQLYTDASLQGLGGFYYSDSTHFWSEIVSSISQDSVFAVPLVANPLHINILELEAILIAITAWGSLWSQLELILYTDSSTAYNGLIQHTLRRDANCPLWKILLLAAEHDIKIVPQWLSSQENTLADALSCFNTRLVADLCPHWQAPWSSMLLPQSS